MTTKQQREKLAQQLRAIFEEHVPFNRLLGFKLMQNCQSIVPAIGFHLDDGLTIERSRSPQLVRMLQAHLGLFVTRLQFENSVKGQYRPIIVAADQRVPGLFL